MSTFEDDIAADVAAQQAAEDADPLARRRFWQQMQVNAGRLTTESTAFLANMQRLHTSLAGDADKQAQVIALRDATKATLQTTWA